MSHSGKVTVNWSSQHLPTSVTGSISVERSLATFSKSLKYVQTLPPSNLISGNLSEGSNLIYGKSSLH
jgi:hypothetical protein